MQLSLIAALTKQHVIGQGNQLPWHLPADLKHFKTITLGKVIIMGRKTYESLGKALPNRTNVVISRNLSYDVADAVVLPSLPVALKKYEGETELIVIGGGELFKQALPLAQRMYLTLIEADISGDVFFPPWNSQAWRMTSRVDYPADDKHAYAYSFIKLNKRIVP